MNTTMNTTETCPPVQELQRLLTGQISEHAVGSLEEHLGHCPRCRATFDMLASEDTTVQGRRTLAGPEVAADKEVIDGLIGNLKKLPDLASQTQVQPQSPVMPPTTARGTLTSSGFRFRILRAHARGGLGQVYVAHDEELHRDVALKEIQDRHADDPESRARFMLEAEITGGLEHPGIVPVYGLGSYDDGRPFYAMRFIKGESLKDAIDRFHKAEDENRDRGEQTVEFRKLLARFIDVCNAVAYAHSRGVLHRDLKPGNIMLGKYGETLVVDWGLAKTSGARPVANGEEGAGAAEASAPGVEAETPLRRSGTVGSADTQPGRAMGTPQYMSPEQAAGRLDLLGPASDVYSLGATLYCLLTGKGPFADKDVSLVLHKVQRGDFPRPGQVKASVSSGLAAICLKAMALEPAARYPSPRSLADDIERWLAGEPVSAWREPWTVKARRWLGKHRSLVTGAAAALLAGLVGLIVATVLLSAANEELAFAKNKAEGAMAAESEAREAAQTKEAATRAVLDFVENHVFAAARPKGRAGGLGAELTVRQAVEAALPSVNKSFTKQPLIEARLRMTLGMSFWYLAEDQRAAEQFEKARALYSEHAGADHLDTLQSMNNLAKTHVALGRHADAVKLHEETLRLRKARLNPDHPDVLESMNNLAVSYNAFGRYTDAVRLHEETLRLRQARLGPDHPDTLESMNDLAESYIALGRRADAARLHEDTLRLRKATLDPDHPDTLESMNNLAVSYQALGRYADAAKLHQETLRLRQAKLGPNHPDTFDSMNNLGESYAALGRHAEALKLHEETLRLRQAKLGRNHPSTFESMNNLGESYSALGRNAEALKLHEETLRLRQAKLGANHPETLQSMNNLAVSYAAVGRNADALKLHEETLNLRQAKLGPDHPDTLQTMNDLAGSYATLGRHTDALHLHEKTLRLRQGKLGPDHPDTLVSMWGVAKSLAELKRSADALPIIDECVQRAAGKVVDPALIPAVMYLRLRHFENRKDAAGCRATAEMFERLKQTDAQSLYSAACFRAVTAAVILAADKSERAAKKADAEADRAMVWLTQAIAAGYHDAAQIREDDDLDALRDRADFKKLVAGRATGTAKQKK